MTVGFVLASFSIFRGAKLEKGAEEKETPGPLGQVFYHPDFTGRDPGDVFPISFAFGGGLAVIWLCL